MNDDEKSTAEKTIESYQKHEAIVEKAVESGKNAGYDVEATNGNDSRGDIRVAKDDAQEYLDHLGRTIDGNRNKDDT
jgi:outer membrane protein TolC